MTNAFWKIKFEKTRTFKRKRFHLYELTVIISINRNDDYLEHNPSKPLLAI